MSTSTKSTTTTRKPLLVPSMIEKHDRVSPREAFGLMSRLHAILEKDRSRDWKLWLRRREFMGAGHDVLVACKTAPRMARSAIARAHRQRPVNWTAKNTAAPRPPGHERPRSARWLEISFEEFRMPASLNSLACRIYRSPDGRLSDRLQNPHEATEGKSPMR